MTDEPVPNSSVLAFFLVESLSSEAQARMLSIDRPPRWAVLEALDVASSR